MEYFEVSIKTSKARGGRRYLPYAFTEQGIAMLSSVLRSQKAIKVNIGIMRAFVLMRQFALQMKILRRKFRNWRLYQSQLDFRIIRQQDPYGIIPFFPVF
jgi:hypothetical protein